VVVVCGALVRGVGGRFSAELSGALVDFQHLIAVQKVELRPAFISCFKLSLIQSLCARLELIFDNLYSIKSGDPIPINLSAVFVMLPV
jgi:hypothetical protein